MHDDHEMQTIHAEYKNEQLLLSKRNEMMKKKIHFVRRFKEKQPKSNKTIQKNQLVDLMIDIIRCLSRSTLYNYRKEIFFPLVTKRTFNELINYIK